MVYREPMPVWQSAVLVLLLGVWFAIFLAVLSPPLDSFLIDRLFAWLPDWFFATNFVNHLDQ